MLSHMIPGFTTRQHVQGAAIDDVASMAEFYLRQQRELQAPAFHFSPSEASHQGCGLLCDSVLLPAHTIPA